jgi:ribonuclease BN (tRNA processing enzyme)
MNTLLWGIKIQASITFLGTGQGSFVVGRNILSSGGIVLQVDENQFHIDPGPNSLKNAAQNQINLRATTALLVSHSHLNHSNDINAVIDAMTYSGFDKKGVLVANKTTINPIEEQKTPLTPYYRDFLERFIVLEAGQRVGINEVEVLALKTKHSEQAIGFKFFTPYFTLAYSSDTKYFPELIEEYKNSNILILNVPYIKKEDAKNNLCIEDAIKIIKEVSPRLAIIQHFGIDIVKSDPMYQIREIQKATGVQTIAAKDGMVINPLSYSVDQGQRTLQALTAGRKIEVREEKSEETPQETIEEPQQEIEEQSEIIEEQPELVKTDDIQETQPEQQETLEEEQLEIIETEEAETSQVIEDINPQIVEEETDTIQQETPQEQPETTEESNQPTAEEQSNKDILNSNEMLKDILRED